MRVWPFRRSRAAEDAELLLGEVVAASRNRALFGEGAAPDSLEGRFELLTLFASLALVRIGRDGGAAPLAQEFTDRFFRHLDAGLREAGVGDLAVPKRMRKLAGDFFGRLQAYERAILAGEAALLAEALARNVEGLGAPHELAAATLVIADRQAALPVGALLGPEAWRQPER